MKPILIVSALAGLASVGILLDAKLPLWVNGARSKAMALQTKDETYVPLSALREAGIDAKLNDGGVVINFSAKGGANQTSAVEGVQDQWLFNGIWRFKASSPKPEDEGFDVVAELRNGSKADDLSLSGTGFDSVRLALQDGTLLECTGGVGEMTSTGFAQGSGQTFTLHFINPEGKTSTPAKLVLLIKSDADLKKYLSGRLNIAYSVPDPSFRVNFKK